MRPGDLAVLGEILKRSKAAAASFDGEAALWLVRGDYEVLEKAARFDVGPELEVALSVGCAPTRCAAKA